MRRRRNLRRHADGCAEASGEAISTDEAESDSIRETLYLLSDPDLLPDIEEAERTHDEAKDWRECFGIPHRHRR